MWQANKALRKAKRKAECKAERIAIRAAKAERKAGQPQAGRANRGGGGDSKRRLPGPDGKPAKKKVKTKHLPKHVTGDTAGAGSATSNSAVDEEAFMTTHEITIDSGEGVGESGESYAPCTCLGRAVSPPPLAPITQPYPMLVGWLIAGNSMTGQRLCLSLAAAPFPAALVGMLHATPGITAPSPVQASTWPVAVTGRDVLAIAKTGSGKTLGFLLPVLSRCHVDKRSTPKGHPLALIMAPTRELALQIAAVASKFGGCVGCRAVAVYGGSKKGPQVKALQRGCELIIGTPGRIMDVFDVRGEGYESCVDVSSMRVLVLDEADRMLDMGFEDDIRKIIWHAFEERKKQTFLYSATWPITVQGVAGDLLSNPCKVTVGKGGRKLTASRSVTQRVHVVADENARWETFLRLMKPFAVSAAAPG